MVTARSPVEVDRLRMACGESCACGMCATVSIDAVMALELAVLRCHDRRTCPPDSPRWAKRMPNANMAMNASNASPPQAGTAVRFEPGGSRRERQGKPCLVAVLERGLLTHRRPSQYSSRFAAPPRTALRSVAFSIRACVRACRGELLAARETSHDPAAISSTRRKASASNGLTLASPMGSP